MEVISIIVLLGLTALPLYIGPTWLSKAIFALVLFVVGLLVQIGGITMTSFLHNTTNYTLVQTGSTVSFMLLLVLTLGSILSIMTLVLQKNENDDENG